MLKQAVTYKNFDDVDETKELYFNLTRVEVMENLDLEQPLEEMQKVFTQAGEEGRELSAIEIRMMMDIVKRLMKLSYGVRHDDGRFEKSEEVWTNFTQTLAYDAFLFGLFENQGAGAVNFMVSIIPQALRDDPAMKAKIAEAQQQVADLTGDQPQVGPNSVEMQQPAAPTLASVPPVPVAPPEIPDSQSIIPEKTWDQYTREELLNMSKEQFDKLVGTDPQQMDRGQLMIAMQRKSQS